MPRRDMAVIKLDEKITKAYNMIQKMRGRDRRITELIKKNSKLNSEGHSVCFVIACGPSIKTVNLEPVKKYDTITVNFFHQGMHDFESKYHVFFDPGFQTEFRDYVNQFCDAYPNTKIIMKYDKAVTKTIDPRFYYVDARYVDDGSIRYSMTDTMTGSVNVVPIAIECALSMGYKTIYLLGCDFSMYTRVKNQHFYDKGLNEHNTVDARDDIELNNVGNLIRCAFVHKQHYELNKLANELGARIINATDESLIDAYEMIEYRELEKRI